MPAVKAEKPKVKAEARAEKDPDLELALRLSLQSVKKQQVGVKAEQRSGVKAEQGVTVKAESVKVERGAPPAVKAESNLPPLRAKVEQLRQVKSELLRGSQQEGGSSSSIDKLLARADKIRKTQTAVKREKLKRGKGRFGPKLLKVKKERPLNKDGSRRKKIRYTAKGRKARREVMNRDIPLSDELSDLLGADALARPEAVRRLWSYCKEKGMINPDNRREVKFDSKLQKIMGQKKAQSFELMGLLNPHFEYHRMEVKQEAKREPGAKKEQHVKSEAKKEQQHTTKRETKEEKQSSPRKSTAAKRELHAEPQVVKVAKHEAKRETSEDATLAANAIFEESLCAIMPSIYSFDRTSALIQCSAPLGNLRLEAVATPTSDARSGGLEVRAACNVEFREGKTGELEPHVEARLTNLDPKLAYRVTIRICSGGPACSHEVLLPQRAHPGKWTSNDVAVWCGAQHTPELVRMARDYAIDGQTLLSLGSEDLKASGVVAPFLLRRTLASLDALRAAGT